MTTRTAPQISPLPWKVDCSNEVFPEGEGGESFTEFLTIQDANGKVICELPGHSQYARNSEACRTEDANSAYLVKCANSFPALLAALEDVADYFYGKMMAAQETHDTEDFAEYTDRFNRASAAIAAAKAP